jgi:flagellar biogenesis protein FliO
MKKPKTLQDFIKLIFILIIIIIGIYLLYAIVSMIAIAYSHMNSYGK